jgi:hypothetical protein
VFRQEGLQAKIETNAWREEIRRRSREGAEATLKAFTDYNGNRVVETHHLEDGAKYHLNRPLRKEPCAKCGRIGHTWPKRGDGIGVIMFAGMNPQNASIHTVWHRRKAYVHKTPRVSREKLLKRAVAPLQPVLPSI